MTDLLDGRAFARRAATALAFVAPAWVILVHPTLDIMRRNPEHFTAGYAAGWSMYLAAVLLIAVGVVLWRLRERSAVARFLVTVYLLSGVGWFLYVFADLVLDARLWLFAALVVLLTVAAGRMSNAIEGTLQTLGLAGLLLIVGLSVSVVTAGTSTAEGTTDRTGASGDSKDDRSDLPNVYHLVFDEFQTDLFELALTEELERELAGFRFYPEASTPYGRTEMAMASVFASRPYDYDEPLRDYIERAFTDDASLVGRLHEAGYETTGWLHGLEFFGWESPFELTFLHHEVSRARSDLVEQSALVRSTWIHTNLPTLLAEPLMPTSHFEQLQRGALLPEEAPPRSVDSFHEFLGDEGDLPDRGRYTIVHLIVPHVPYVLDADCEVARAGSTALEQTGCALRVVSELVGTLRELDRCEDSMIVVQGDHGARFEVEDGQLVDVEAQGLFSEAWSRARSRPLLLVKPPGSATEPLQTSDVRPPSRTSCRP